MSESAHELWLVAVPDSEIKALHAIRHALRYFEPSASLDLADGVLEAFKIDGYAFVAYGPYDAMEEIKEQMKQQGCEAVIDLDIEAYESRRRVREMTASGATPEEVFAAEAPGRIDATATTLVLIAASEGNPIRAAITAANLARTTGDKETYHGVIASLVGAFPWLPEVLDAKP
jgi:hypothetical protein